MNRLALAALLCAAPAAALPRLDLCRPLAPKTCDLPEKAGYEGFLKCFEGVTLDEKDPKQAACAPELLHAKVHVACDPADVPKACAGVKPGGDRVMTCLRAHRKSLSAPCRDALKAYDAWYKKPAVRKRRGSAVSAAGC